METEQRMLKLGDGKRMPIRMEGSAWAAVDWLSGRDFVQWDEWCKKAIDAAGGGNATSSIRTAIIDGLLFESIQQERADANGMPPATGFGMAGICWRQEDFDYAVSQATVLEGRQDLVSVEVIAGIDEFGRVCYYIQNKLKDCPSMTISVPLTPSQWLGRMEEWE